MKQLRLFIYILIIGFLFGCESETIPSASTNLVGKISTRGSNDIPSLPTGSQALFNAQGGTSVFTFDGNKWNGNQDIFSGSSTEVTALYPAYNGNSLITENPYTSDGLEDVLIAQSTITSEKNIELTFKHLFSKLTIHILSPLKESVNRISLEMPRIEKLNTDGSFSLSGTYISTPELNEDGDYTFIIPPTKNCNIILSFTIGDQTVSHSLTHTFESGYKYECKIKEPGIYDANDLIEFSKVINGKETTKEWSDFGYIENNDTIYRLLNDIQMTDEESLYFKPIGNHKQTPFSSIFDGNNHTISGLTIYPSNGTLGLFGIITKYSIIKDLQLNNCKSSSVKEDEISSGLGFIASVCYGTLTNCSVTESKLLEISKTSPTGGLVGDARSGSNIINCYSHKNRITSSGYTGGIAGSANQVKIINCFSADNTISCSSAKCGGFIGIATNTQITNCYKFNLTFSSTSNTGQVIGKGSDATISYCYSDSRSPLLINEESGHCIKEPMYYYSLETENIFTIICNRLNKWIGENQPSNPIYTLWQEDTTKELPAIFAE